MDGSEPPATVGTEPNGMIDIITALQQGGEDAPFGTNDEPCDTMVQNVEEILHDLSSNDTEDGVAESIEPVEYSFFDTASVGTDPHSTLF